MYTCTEHSNISAALKDAAQTSADLNTICFVTFDKETESFFASSNIAVESTETILATFKNGVQQ